VLRALLETSAATCFDGVKLPTLRAGLHLTWAAKIVRSSGISIAIIREANPLPVSLLAHALISCAERGATLVLITFALVQVRRLVEDGLITKLHASWTLAVRVDRVTNHLLRLFLTAEAGGGSGDTVSILCTQASWRRRRRSWRW